MAVYQERYCPKCRKKVKMIRCEACKGQGRTATTQCKSGCNEKGYTCPTHGKYY